MAFSAASPSSHPPEESHQRTPRYPGEDTTPTSKQEIWGWYAYGIAAEVFAVCAVGSLDCLFWDSMILILIAFSNRLVFAAHLGATSSRTWRPAVEPLAMCRTGLPYDVTWKWDRIASPSPRWG